MRNSLLRTASDADSVVTFLRLATGGLAQDGLAQDDLAAWIRQSLTPRTP